MPTHITLNIVDVDFFGVDYHKINEIIQDLNIKKLDIKVEWIHFSCRKIFILIACDIIIKKRKDICLYYSEDNISDPINEKNLIKTIIYIINCNAGCLEEYFYDRSTLPDYVENWLYDGKKTGNFYLDLSDHVIQKLTECRWSSDINVPGIFIDQLLIRMLSFFKNSFNDVHIPAEFLRNKEILNLLVIQLNRQSYTNDKNDPKQWKNDFKNTIHFKNEHKIYVANIEKKEYNKIDKYNSIFKELCAKTGCDLKIYYGETFREYRVYKI